MEHVYQHNVKFTATSFCSIGILTRSTFQSSISTTCLPSSGASFSTSSIPNNATLSQSIGHTTVEKFHHSHPFDMDDDSLQPGMIAGIVISAIAFILLLGGCIFYFGQRNRRKGFIKPSDVEEKGWKQEPDGYSMYYGSRCRRNKAIVTECVQELPDDLGFMKVACWWHIYARWVPACIVSGREGEREEDREIEMEATDDTRVKSAELLLWGDYQETYSTSNRKQCLFKSFIMKSPKRNKIKSTKISRETTSTPTDCTRNNNQPPSTKSTTPVNIKSSRRGHTNWINCHRTVNHNL